MFVFIVNDSNLGQYFTVIPLNFTVAFFNVKLVLYYGKTFLFAKMKFHVKISRHLVLMIISKYFLMDTKYRYHVIVPRDLIVNDVIGYNNYLRTFLLFQIWDIIILVLALHLPREKLLYWRRALLLAVRNKNVKQ